MRKRRTFAALAAVAAVAAGSTMGAQAFAAGPHQSTAGRSAQAPRLDHVFVIMLENHSQSSVIGNANAPFMNRLAKKNVIADHYYGVTHPSMPNYIAAIAGDNFGIQDDEDENVVNLKRRNLVDQLESRHVRWAAYMETLPPDKLARYWPQKTNADGTKTDIKLYAKKHNPFVLFDDIKNNPRRMNHVRDYSRMASDLNKKGAPQFVWISPNQCNDMHGGVYDTVAGHPETPCPYGSAKDDANDAALKKKADSFVRTAVHTIRSSKAWTKHSAIVIVTDENDYTGNTTNGGWENADGCCDSPYVAAHDPRVSKDWPGGTYGGGLIPAIIVSPQGPHGYVDHTKYNHYSLLTTLEENWHVRYLGHAGDRAGGVRPMWKSFMRR
ncbi:MAG TPA: alkaline phosphatase family protein [Nocardioidaceae bacterium]|nr:alkaline phosphatase family protein [Nocardioidaceae bacterium]